MAKVALKIEGMSCGHCVKAIDQALKSLAGVQVEQVNVGSAVVAYDPAAVQPAAIEAAVMEEGYRVTSIEEA